MTKNFGMGMTILGLGVALIAWVEPDYWKNVSDLIRYAVFFFGIVLAVVGLLIMLFERLKPREGAALAVVRAATTPFDIKQWQNHHSYPVWQAACLWVPMEPEPSIPQTHPAYPSLSHIKSALATGVIKSLDGTRDMKASISADELRRHAKDRLEYPEFLFLDKMPVQHDDNIRQAGVVVGKAHGGRRMPTDATMFEFVEITRAQGFKLEQPFQFQGVNLRVVRFGTLRQLDVSRVADSPLITSIAARVIG